MDNEIKEKINKYLTETYQVLSLLKIESTDENLNALFVSKNNIKEIAKLVNQPKEG